jgi:Spy/CpxP family protein refolding chaperone
MLRQATKKAVLRNTALSTLMASMLIAPVMTLAQPQAQGQANPPAAPNWGYGHMMGPGMMGGYGQGWGPGQGMMGPGMMGGYGQGWGMGPGMMGGYGQGWGMGPGMMGGYGWGKGQGGAWQALDLNEKQREQIAQVEKELTKTELELRSQMADEYAKLQQLYAAEKPDAAAIGQTYDAIHNLRRQMMQANINANNRMQAVLNEEQRNQLQRWQRGLMMGPYW